MIIATKFVLHSERNNATNSKMKLNDIFKSFILKINTKILLPNNKVMGSLFTAI